MLEIAHIGFLTGWIDQHFDCWWHVGTCRGDL